MSAQAATEEKRGPGAPVGNVNGLKHRRFAEVLTRVLLENDGARLRTVALKLISLAEEGEISAIKEVLDRVDGKVPAGVELTGANGGELVVRDAHTAMGVARRVAFVLAQGALAKAGAKWGSAEVVNEPAEAKGE